MRTLERLARTSRQEGARFTARLCLPGIAGNFAVGFWMVASRLDIDSPMIRGPVAAVAAVAVMSLVFLTPLAVVCTFLAIFRRGRHRLAAVVANGSFLAALVLLSGPWVLTC